MAASNIRFRFAPSPTGLMHIGNLRTAFFNYLYAKKLNGQLLLRIEDTDRERTVSNGLNDIISCLKWANISYSNDIIYQSKRLSIYQEYCQQLIDSKHAYPCFCNNIGNHLRNNQKYNGKCLRMDLREVKDRLMARHKHVVRFKMPNRYFEFNDFVYGPLRINPFQVEGDFIIMRSDGWPTYHLACTVDDHVQQISHVFRGCDWQQSTGKHLALYSAFGWSPPLFGHIPMIMNDAGRKMSKRNADCNVKSLRNLNSQVVLNYLLTNAGLDTRNKLLSFDEMIDVFEPSRLYKTFQRVNLNEIHQLQRRFIAQHSSDFTRAFVKKAHDRYYVGPTLEQARAIVERVESQHVTSIDDLVEQTSYLWLWKKFEISSNNLLKEFVGKLKASDDNDISTIARDVSRSESSELLRIVRLAISGQTVGLPLVVIMDIMGRDEFIRRLEQYVF